MVRPMPNHILSQTNFSQTIPAAIGLFVSVTLLVALCAKHARKYSSETSDEPGTTLPAAAKQLITTINHKAMIPLVHHAKKTGLELNTKFFGASKKKLGQEESGGGGGLWQKAILMGERCQPLEFSGVIYYDYAGNRVPEMPKSPRAGGDMSPLRNFSFPVEKM